MRDFLLRLYPAAWRTRYGDEFDALLAESPLGPFDVADVLLGAVDAHIHRRRDPAAEHRKGLTMSRHLGGTAAVIGGCLVILSQVVRAVSELHGDLVILVGLGMLVFAMAGLCSFQSRQHPIVTWAVFSFAAAGMLVFPMSGIVGYYLAPTGDWVAVRLIGFLALTGGSALFGGLTYRSDAMFRRSAPLLALSGICLLVGLLGVYVEGMGGLSLLFGVGYVLFPLGWIALGLSAIRLDRRLALSTSSATP